jgi:DNA-directed RNA polymerase specialized sigma24 family protein
LKDNNTKQLAALLQQAQAGDKSALETLCCELQTYIKGYLRLKFQDESLVDDLSQETIR